MCTAAGDNQQEQHCHNQDYEISRVCGFEEVGSFAPDTGETCGYRLESAVFNYRLSYHR